MTYDVLCYHPERFKILISLSSRSVPKVKQILTGHKIKEVGSGGGLGWVLGDGEITISGRQLDVERVGRVIVASMKYQPLFRTGAEVLAKNRVTT